MKYKMDWEYLLSANSPFERAQKEKFFEKFEINELEDDYKAIVSSAAFRRLQDKTQVFPLDKSDFVRTRLTHSIEVSAICRQLGLMVTCNKDNKTEEFKDEKVSKSIVSVLSCAGLLHDLGNPPFGHFGEKVIGEWFKNELEKESFIYKKEKEEKDSNGNIQYENIKISEILTKQMSKDLCNFEGNAQSLRILSKGHDTKLTYSVMSALMKYPTASDKYNSEDLNVGKHKFGYFYSERNLFEEISNEVGTIISGEHVRHPLAYLMEAADDIAYSISDVEDALKKGMFSLDEFLGYFKKSARKIKDKNNKYYSNLLVEYLEKNLPKIRNQENDFIAFQNWADYARRWFMYTVSFSFSFNYNNIMNGTYKNELFDDCFHKDSKKILKSIMTEYVYDSSEILRLELAAKKIISSLLNDFIHAVIYWDTKEENFMSEPQKKLINLIPENYKNDYCNSRGNNDSENLYLRFLMITDYISGMTDSYAKNLYQELNGIN